MNTYKGDFLICWHNYEVIYSQIYHHCSVRFAITIVWLESLSQGTKYGPYLTSPLTNSLRTDETFQLYRLIRFYSLTLPKYLRRQKRAKTFRRSERVGISIEKGIVLVILWHRMVVINGKRYCDIATVSAEPGCVRPIMINVAHLFGIDPGG